MYNIERGGLWIVREEPAKICKEVRGVRLICNTRVSYHTKKFASHWYIYIGGGGRETMKKNGEFHSDSFLKPNLPADENYFSLFLFFFVSSYVGMSQKAMIWVFFALFGDVSFCRSFRS